MGIVISREAWESEWVKKEVAAAWQKQMELKRNVLLPIYYRDCKLPALLKDIKYADFRSDYDQGLKDLLVCFGIKDMEVITEDNWRNFASNRKGNWQNFRDQEFQKVITGICKIAKARNWSVGWGTPIVDILFVYLCIMQKWEPILYMDVFHRRIIIVIWQRKVQE